MNDLSILSNDNAIATTMLSTSSVKLFGEGIYPRIGTYQRGIRLYAQDGTYVETRRSYFTDPVFRLREIGRIEEGVYQDFIQCLLNENISEDTELLRNLWNTLYGYARSYTNEQEGGDPSHKFEGIGTYSETKEFHNQRDASIAGGHLIAYINLYPIIGTITYFNTLDNSVIATYSDYVSYINDEGYLSRKQHDVISTDDVGNHQFLYWLDHNNIRYHPSTKEAPSLVDYNELDKDDYTSLPINLSAIYQKRWKIDLYNSYEETIITSKLTNDKEETYYNPSDVPAYLSCNFKEFKSNCPNFELYDYGACKIKPTIQDGVISAIYNICYIFKDSLDIDPVKQSPKTFSVQWYEIGSYPEFPTAPDHRDEGYYFAGWSPSEITLVTEPCEVTAQYVRKMYTVTFKDGYNGRTISTIERGEYYQMTDNDFPTRDQIPDHSNEGYIFVEWQPGSGTTITANTTFVAIYKKNSTVIFYDTVGKSIIKQIDDVQYGADVQAPEDSEIPTHRNYEFGKWEPQKWNPIRQDTTVFAQYKFDITFVDNETKEEIAISTVYKDNVVNPPTTPDHTDIGKVFNKWNPTEAAWNPAQYPLSVYALYRLTSYYNVTFIDNYDGSIVNEQEVLLGSAAIEPAFPIHSKYVAIKWNPSTSYVTCDITATPIYTEVPEIAGNFEIGNLIDIKAVQNSLHNIFGWIPGQRILYPEFGSNLRKLLYEGITTQNAQNIIAEIKYAINTWEPRITVNDIYDASTTDDHNNNQIHLIVVYSIPTLSDQKYQYDYVQNMTSF